MGKTIIPFFYLTREEYFMRNVLIINEDGTILS